MSIVLQAGQSWFAPESALRAASDVLATLGTDVSQELKSKLDSGDHLALAKFSVSPKDYTDALTFAKDYQASSLVRKAAFLKTGVDRKGAATTKFLEAEKLCEETNERLFAFMDSRPGASQGAGNKIASGISTARGLIRQILRDDPMMARMRFGPGATSLVTGGITLPQKYSREIHVTPELYPFWRDICGPNWCKLVRNVEYVSGSKVAYVPKTALTDRTIGIEPHLNIYAQLGVGGMMRQLFKPWVDLNVGQERNRALAQRANYGLATVDFESASDTVSRALVWLLLPEKWALLLDRVRSHRFILSGEEYVFQKHSSMGNGYTFELESIIFYALARAACWDGSQFFAEQVAAYGDDVILPQSFAQDFIDLCEYCGFRVNRSKSFLDGRFFESCGEDYFDGVNVRPKFWKEVNPLLGFKVHNDIIAMSKSLRTPALRDVADALRRSGPDSLRYCLIPSRGYGDSGWHVPFDVATPSVLRARDGWCGFRTKALKFRPDQRRYHSYVSGLLAALDSESMQSVSPVRGRGSWQVGSLVTFGDWDA